MRSAAAALAAAVLVVAPPAAALVLEFPAAAVQTVEQFSAFDSHRIAISAFHDGSVDQILAEGRLEQRAWRVGNGRLTTLELLAPMRAQLEAAGFDILFECADQDCGGFDFRFEIDVLPEPEMYVDIGDFRYLAARRAGPVVDYISLLVSGSPSAGFVQMTRMGAPDDSVLVEFEEGADFEPDPEPEPEPDAAAAPSDPGIVAQLLANGHVALADLRFETGSAALGAERFASLEELAAFLIDEPSRRLALVGHTDAEGSLQNNIALSKRRAEAVADRLLSTYDIAPGRITAEGVGYLAPVASNATEDGRRMNRRVEAVLLEGG